MQLNQEIVNSLREKNIYIPVGNYDVSDDFIIHGPCHFGSTINTLSIRNINPFSYSVSHIAGSIQEIGRYCSFGSSITFGEMEHPTNWLSSSSFTYDRHFLWGDYAASKTSNFEPAHLPYEQKRRGIIVGNDVWIGARSYIRGGVNIGDGAIIGTNTVVTKDVPPYAVVVGNPGRVIKFRFSDRIIERLLNIQWWRFDYLDFAGVKVDDAVQSLDKIEDLISSGKIQPYNPTPVRLSDFA